MCCEGQKKERYRRKLLFGVDTKWKDRAKNKEDNGKIVYKIKGDNGTGKRRKKDVKKKYSLDKQKKKTRENKIMG
jgi:hypothetical protein